MKQEPYYLAYEKRYRAVYAAGCARWGHAPDDPGLVEALTRWVADHGLGDRRVIEFACGEGASGVILSRLGCRYHGVDIAPAAVERARAALADFPAATVARLDMVHERVDGPYDGAVDCMGFHMLITDSDRRQYLANARDALAPGAPMLFFRQLYDPAAYGGPVDSFDHWLAITGGDYTTPQLRVMEGSEAQVSIPLVPGRARSKEGYIEELTGAGFMVDAIEQMPQSWQNPNAVSIWVRKG